MKTKKLTFKESDLSNLDVTQNQALTYLEVSNNNLSTLNVSNNTLLEKLY